MSEELPLVTVTAKDGRDLLIAAESDWSRAVPHCPGWSAADLVGHMGAILAWMTTIVTTGQRVAREDRETPPADLAELTTWYSSHLDRTVEILASTPADAEAWTFSSLGEHTVGWWRRRLSVELGIHRWDGQHAAGLESSGPPPPLNALVAEAGIGEFLTEFLPAMLAKLDNDRPTGTLSLLPTDSSTRWCVDLDAATKAVVLGEEEADSTICGSASDLLLWLTNRAPTPSIEIRGRRDGLGAWAQLRR